MKRFSCVLLLLMCTGMMSAPSFAGVVAFGDSLVDVGNVAAAGAFPYPDSPYFEGQFSNGPTWVQTFANELGLEPTQPSLVGGSNYGFAGATAAPNPSASVPSVADQVTQYLGMNSVSIGTDYHLFWAGGNDAIQGIASLQPTELLSGMPLIAETAAGSLVSSVQQLIDAGATKIVVSNLSNLGDLPLAQASGPLAASIFELYAQSFNDALESGLSQLEQSASTPITRLDQIALYAKIEEDPSAFGLQNLEDPALDIDLNPLSPGFGDPVLPYSVDENPNEFFWFDSVHPTAATHQIVGKAAAAAAVPEPTSQVVWLMLIVSCFLFRYIKLAGNSYLHGR